MSATINQLSGRTQVAEFWVDEAVVSIGSNAGCSIRIPNVDAEACILQYVDGLYYLHNRSRRSIRLESQAVRPGEAIVWETGEKLQVNRQVSLVLVADGAPEKRRRQVEEKPEVPAVDEPDASGRTNRQMIAASACIALSVVLALSAASSQPRNRSALTFEMLVGGMLAEQPARDQKVEIMLTNLQQARYRELRNDRTEAVNLYGEVRDDLINRSQGNSSSLATIERELYDFVRDRLELLAQ